MVITIYEGIKKGSAIVECRRKEFTDKYGKYGSISFTTDEPIKTMTEISKWCNNELNEECLFEIG